MKMKYEMQQKSDNMICMSIYLSSFLFFFFLKVLVKVLSIVNDPSMHMLHFVFTLFISSVGSEKYFFHKFFQF